MSKLVNLELDDLDLRLAKELELDARQTIRLLSRKLATSEEQSKGGCKGSWMKGSLESSPFLIGYCWDSRSG